MLGDRLWSDTTTLDGPRPIYLWNPVGFDPVLCLGEPLKKRADLARFILHKIHWNNVFKTSQHDGFVALKAEYLRKYFPGNPVYKEVIGRLIASGVIVCDNSYIIGEKSLGFQLNEELSKMRQHRVRVTDSLLQKKIASNRAEWLRSLKGVHRHLNGYLEFVKIDYDAAHELLLNGDFEPTDETAIEFIRDKQFFYHVCDYGRVHTNLTNLNGDLRRFLMYRGESLVNLDIRNSQPLIFAAILKDHYEFDGDLSGVPADVVKYVELVQAGRFYDHLMDEAGIDPEHRSVFKGQFFGRVFFCKNHPIREEAALFGELFPNVYSVIRDRKAEDYTQLSKSLQRKESSIMIGGVATRCMLELPHVFIATIHDSVLTTPKHAGAIMEIMRDEFLKAGLEPTIREEQA